MSQVRALPGEPDASVMISIPNSQREVSKSGSKRLRAIFSALPIMPSVAAGGRKLLKVIGMDSKVKLPPADATKEDRRPNMWLLWLMTFSNKEKAK